MSAPISRITSTASGLTRVASVPALKLSNRSPAICLSSPSAIWERAELWVHRNRTLFLLIGAPVGRPPWLGHSPGGPRRTRRRGRPPRSRVRSGKAPALRGRIPRRDPAHRLGEEPLCGLAIEGVEAPLPPLLFPDQAGLLEFFHVVGDL